MDTPAGNDARIPFVPDGRQTALLEALSQKDPRLGEMYLGALIVFNGVDNPDRLAQTCHSLRELMEKIPKWYAAVPAAEELPRMGDKVRTLRDIWKNCNTSTSRKSDGWQGAIDESLAKFLLASENFFAWLETDMPMRKQRTAGLFRQLDQMRLPLPSRIEELKVEEWSSCREYFVSIAHHNSLAAPEDVSRWMYFLEGFLLDLIKPRTFEKQEEIDAIIQRGEGNADAR